MVKQTPNKPEPALFAGKPGPGRKKGVPNKTTTQLKEAILAAGEAVGQDGNGKDGLTGYLTTLAQDQPVAFAGLLGKVLPMQMVGDPENPIVVSEIRLVGVRADT